MFSATTQLSFTMDDPSCSLTGDTTTVHVQNPPISETATSILPQLLPILWIVNHPPQSVVPMTDRVANIVEPRNVSAQSHYYKSADDHHFPFFMHESGKKAITFECLLTQIQNQNQSIPYRTAIHLSSNKWLNAKYFICHMLVYKTIGCISLTCYE